MLDESLGENKQIRQWNIFILKIKRFVVYE